MTSRRLLLLVPWAVAVVITGPLLLQRGFWLFGDMVFTPRQPWKPEWYGGDGGVPRAVPSDALVSLATHVVPGDLVQKAVLVAIFGFAGWGVLRLFSEAHPVAAVVACVFFQWNPFVFERLAIGHWALLCGYAALPWVAAGAARFAAHGRPAWAAMAVPLAVAAWTSPTGGAITSVCALGAAVAVAGGRKPTRLTGLVATTVVINLPWLVPGLLATSGAPVDTTGATAFAARSDTPLGALASVLTLGGMWKTSVTPGERSSALLVAMALLVACLGLLGAVLAVRRRTSFADGLVPGLALSGLPLLAFVLATTTSGGREFSAWLATTVPGGGIVRDSQKFLAPLALLMAVGLGVGLEMTVRWFRHRFAMGVVPLAALVVVVQLVSLPSLAWGNLGRWQVSTYPAEWSAVAAQVSEESLQATPTTVVLPFTIYRRFEWNGHWAWLDPAPRVLPGRVIVDDTLGAPGGAEVAGESAAARRVRDADASWTDLAPVLDDLGARFVLIEFDTPGELPAGAPSEVGYREVHVGDHLALYDTGSDSELRTLPAWSPFLLALDGVLAAMMLAVAVRAGVRRITRRA